MKLFYSPGACSLAPHIALLEAGLEFSLETVDLATKATGSGADFLAINSKGYIPALQLDDGAVLTEGAVIALYIADLKPAAGLIPVSGLERYQVLSWMTFISTEVHKPMASFFNPAQSADWRASVEALLAKRFDWLVADLASKPYLTGESFTIADAYLFTVLGWTGHVRFDLSRWPALQQFQQRVMARPAVLEAMKQEGLLG